MKKIPTLFVRNPDAMKLVTDKVLPSLEWVLHGTCITHEKLDGTACAVLNGRLYKRHTASPGRDPTPQGFIPSDVAPAQSSSGPKAKWPGWIPVGDGPDDRWHREAIQELPRPLKDGTYELIGPKVQGNSYGCKSHHLMDHRRTERFVLPRLSFKAIHDFLAEAESAWQDDLPLGPHFIEGLVFWGPEGPVCKIKRRDFGFSWPVKKDAGK